MALLTTNGPIITVGAARINHRDDVWGSMAAGKRPDLVVASDDPLTAPNLAAVTATATFIDGMQVAPVEA